MKLTGALLLLLAAAGIGCRAAADLRNRVQYLRLLRQLLTAICTELRGNLPLIPDLLHTLAANPAYRSLHFLRCAAADAAQFPDCWQRALADDPAPDADTRRILETVGQTLGSTTLSGQLDTLHLCDERLQHLLHDAEQSAAQKGQLYRSLGILSGIFLVILII